MKGITIPDVLSGHSYNLWGSWLGLVIMDEKYIQSAYGLGARLFRNIVQTTLSGRRLEFIVALEAHGFWRKQDKKKSGTQPSRMGLAT